MIARDEQEKRDVCCAPHHGAEEGGAEQHEEGDEEHKQRCGDERNDGDRAEEHPHCVTGDCTEFGAEEIPVSAEKCTYRDDQLPNVVAESLALR